MAAQALPVPTRPARAGPRQLWANGWGARLILVGSLLSLTSLWASWGLLTHRAGYGEYTYDHRPNSELMHPGYTAHVFLPGETVDGGNAFERDAVAAWFLAGLMGVSVYVAARPQPPTPSAGRWVPLACTALLVLNGMSSEVQLVRDSENYMAGAPAAISVAQGIGPLWLVACQLLAGLGGVLFFRGRRAQPPP